MDVGENRYGFGQRDRDELALQVENIFKRFLEEYPEDDFDEVMMDAEEYLTEPNPSNLQGGDAQSTSSPSKEPTAKKFVPKYSKEALLLLTNERNTLYVDFKDLELFDDNLSEDVNREYHRFYPYLCRALAAFVREEKLRQVEEQLDPLMDNAERILRRDHVKKELDRPSVRNKDYYVGFYNFPEIDNIRSLTCARIGRLTRVCGQVVRTHSVHPELMIGCFKCKDCLTEQYVVQQFKYTLPIICANENCFNRRHFQLILDKSRFTDFQRLRIQETQQELPRGNIPRSFDVIVRGADQVECIQPGDQCDFVGCLIAIPDLAQMMSGIFGTVSSEIAGECTVTGLKSMGVKDMSHTLAFLASACTLEGKEKPVLNTDSNLRCNVYGGGLEASDFTKHQIEQIEKMRHDKKLLENLSQSMFSSIYGGDDIKKGVLLQLLGGVAKQTATGSKLRGDINICLVGDPSTAKSQLLKVVTDFSPVRAVYASGKASTASGLTAAVVRDADGGFVIEAGALMLADRGICCIDEFDKMDLKDQVAIHEAMEQQTISITKAGVTATLHARASILAAANPVGGSYDMARDLKSNVNLSLPIMSRFDLFFLITDPHEEENDRRISGRILDLHVKYDEPEKSTSMIYSFDQIRLYLKFARNYYPKIPCELESLFEQEYVKLRANSIDTKTSWRVTVRQLESLIRLSEAIARSYCSEVVKPEYVKMASSLIKKTIVSVGKSSVELMDNVANHEQEVFDMEKEVQKQHILKISFAQYRNIVKVLMCQLKNECEDPTKEIPAMKRSDLVDWYLNSCVDEIATEAELIRKKEICEKILNRLIKLDNLIIEVTEEASIVDASKAGEDGDALIAIHPQVEFEDFMENVML